MPFQSLTKHRASRADTLGLALFVTSALLFGLGVVLMLVAGSTVLGHQAPLMLMTVAAVEVCLATALSAVRLPAAEKMRLRTLSIVGAVLVVIAAAMISSAFQPRAFEILIMLVVLAGAPGLYRAGEMLGARLQKAVPARGSGTRAPTATDPGGTDSTGA